TETSTSDGFDLSWVEASVLPEYRGRGIGTALAETLEDAARADGRRRVVAYVPGHRLGGTRLPSPTGFGSVAADARETGFLRARGYSLEQVERLSRLPLPVPRLDVLLADAHA